MGKMNFAVISFITTALTFLSDLNAQTNSHPHLFFDQSGIAALRTRILENQRLNKIWLQFKTERVDSSFKIQVTSGRIADVDIDIGRAYGDALGDLSIAYIVLQDPIYLNKAIEIMSDLAAKSEWGERLVKAHISMGFAFAWDVMYDQFSASQKSLFRNAVVANADNSYSNDVYTNVNWTSSAG